MTMLRDRVHDERGATYIMALIFFLVCAMVAAVIIMAASVNAEHADQQARREQAYLTLSSAAQMLSDDLVEQQPRCTSTVVTRSYGCTYTHSDAGVTSSKTAITDAQGAALSDTALMTMFQKGVAQVSAGGGAYSRTFTVSTAGLSDVEGTFTMGTTYDIAIVLTSSSTDYAYTMTLSSKATAGTPTTSSTVATGADSHADGDWVWYLGYGVLHQFFPDTYPVGDTRYGYYETNHYDITDTTTATTVSWGAPTITRGSAE